MFCCEFIHDNGDKRFSCPLRTASVNAVKQSDNIVNSFVACTSLSGRGRELVLGNFRTRASY